MGLSQTGTKQKLVSLLVGSLLPSPPLPPPSEKPWITGTDVTMKFTQIVPCENDLHAAHADAVLCKRNINAELWLGTFFYDKDEVVVDSVILLLGKKTKPLAFQKSKVILVRAVWVPESSLDPHTIGNSMLPDVLALQPELHVCGCLRLSNTLHITAGYIELQVCLYNFEHNRMQCYCVNMQHK